MRVSKESFWFHSHGSSGSEAFPLKEAQVGVGQNYTTRGPQVLVHVSTYQGSIWGTDF